MSRQIRSPYLNAVLLYSRVTLVAIIVPVLQYMEAILEGGTWLIERELDVYE